MRPTISGGCVKARFWLKLLFCRVSAVTGEGLEELKRQLASLAREESRRDRSRIARLPIDRSFAVKGFGTVVTGTLWSGMLRVGETVELHPLKRQARIRGLQVHGQQVELAMAGDRTAVNLAGAGHSELHWAEIRRGCVLAPPQLLEPTMTMDAAVDWLAGSEIPSKRQEFLLHIGTAEVLASVKTWEERSPFARLHLSQPVLALPGDRFVCDAHRRRRPPREDASSIHFRPNGSTVLEPSRGSPFSAKPICLGGSRCLSKRVETAFAWKISCDLPGCLPMLFFR